MYRHIMGWIAALGWTCVWTLELSASLPFDFPTSDFLVHKSG